MLDRTRFEHEIAALREGPEDACVGKSYYLPIKRNTLLKGRPTGVYVPCAARAAAKIDLIVYFHGFISTCGGSLTQFAKKGIEYYWGVAPFDQMRPRLEASGRAAVLIAPTLHEWVGQKGSGSDRGGDMQSAGRFDQLVDDTVAELKRRGAIDPSADIGNIVLAAHSGGGVPMADTLGAKNARGGQIRACWGFECMYYGVPTYKAWLKHNPKVKFRHYRQDTVQKWNVAPLVSLKNFEDNTTTTANAHCQLIDEFWDTVIGTLPAKAGDAKASFELELDHETVDDIAAVAPQCVAKGFDLVAKARSLDGPEVAQTKSAAPYMKEARIYFDALWPLYLERSVKGGFSLRGLRDGKEFELGRKLMDMALGTLRTVQFKTAVGGTVGGYWDMLDTTMKAARYFFEIAADEGVSKELEDAPKYRPGMSAVARKLKLRPCETRVYAWLKRHRRDFTDGAKKWRVTPLAAAGAIAWEALENPMFFTLRSVGPGKPHTRTSPIPGMGSDDTLAKQVETEGYMPRQSAFDRERKLKTPQGAIAYVSAMMGAAADAAQIQGFDIRKDPAVLAAFYQAYDLTSWKAHLARKKAKGETTFQAIDSMAKWTAAHLSMLRAGTGEKA